MLIQQSLLGMLLLLLIALGVPPAATAQEDEAPDLLLRVDDIGMSRAVNLAVQDLAEAGLRFSVSAMPATPWFEEAVEILKEHPQISVGIHLTLNSEWKGYRWGPVLGQNAVPSLVDEMGYFHRSITDFVDSDYDLEEVERELSAQVERALEAGLELDFVDHHMGTAVQTPELRAVVERVAERYGLAISRYFGEHYETLWAVPIEEKEAFLIEYVDNLEPEGTNLVVFHVARDMPEMQLVDMNAASQNTEDGEPLVHLHRNAELEALLSEAFLGRVESGACNLVNYADLVERKGLSAMQRPAD